MVGTITCPFFRKLVGHAHAFAEQPSGVLAQIEHQSLQVPSPSSSDAACTSAGWSRSNPGSCM